MKAISAAIVVLAGSVSLAVGALVPHSDTRLFVMVTGSIVGLIGLFAWQKAFTSDRE